MMGSRKITAICNRLAPVMPVPLTAFYTLVHAKWPRLYMSMTQSTTPDMAMRFAAFAVINSAELLPEFQVTPDEFVGFFEELAKDAKGADSDAAKVKPDVELVYYWDEVCQDSNYALSSLYTTNGDGYDYALLNRNLREGRTVSIRQAMEGEKAALQMRLKEIQVREALEYAAATFRFPKETP